MSFRASKRKRPKSTQGGWTARFRLGFIALIVALLSAQNSRRKKRRRGRPSSLYTKSEVNTLIDAGTHPLARRHWLFILLDGGLHALNEQDPIESFLKFLKYNAPELAKTILKKLLDEQS